MRGADPPDGTLLSLRGSGGGGDYLAKRTQRV
jgi:hypothetical protein